MRAAVVFLLLLGCGHSDQPPATAQNMKPAAGPPEVVREEQPSTSIKRSEVHVAVKSGVGAILQRVIVDTDKPVFRQGKFLGFRITQMPRDWSVDLKPGDVITRVNGFSIERPETAYEALQSLEVASELRVDYERNGEPRSIRYSIVDD